MILTTGQPDVIAATGAEEPAVRRSLRSLLFDPTGSLLQQFARYLAVSGMAFAVDFGLLSLGFAAIAFGLSVLTDYWLSRTWVFNRRIVPNAATEFAIFAAIGLAGLGLNQTLIWFFHQHLIAKAMAAGVVLIWNFSARKSLLFSDSPASRLVLRLTWGSSAFAAAGCFASCLAIQFFAGAWSSDFTTYPDEPAHFLGAVMIRDWLVSGRWLTPLEFARGYYSHYPFFAVGYWPPLFGLVTGAWMALAGVGRVQALLLPAAFAAGTGWLIFSLVRSRAGVWSGLCAGALYLSLPEVRLSICAVMVDHMTTFLCLATGACVIRYLKHPRFSNGLLCALCCGCAILSKYSAGYLVVLPFASALLLRRFELFKRPGFLAQPLMVALMVGPWMLWTRKFAFYGLPSVSPALSVNRAASFVLATLKIFPPVLLAVVILGLLAALLRPAAWREDLAVLANLCAGHLAFLVLSPVGAENRYLLLPAGVLLAMAFIGWSELFALRSPGGRRAGLAFGAVLTLALTAFQFRHVAPMPRGHIRDAVAFIAQDPARSRQRIVLPPTALEGPVIAEFAIESHHRPDAYLLRPSKLLAHSDWFGLHYSSVFSTSADMMEYFRQNPVDLIMWNERSGTPLEMHARIMKEMLRDYPLAWRRIWSTDSADGWTVYRYDTSTGQVAGR